MKKMSKKSGSLYFDNFKACMAISCEAAETLKRLLTDFDAESLPVALKIMHEIEHRGNAKKHELAEELLRAFITPIERDDIMALSQSIDKVTDHIEDIMIRFYITKTTEICRDALDYAELLLRCCRTSYFLLEEFANFKRSEKLRGLIVRIDQLEEEGNTMYVEFRRSLCENCTDLTQIMAWNEIFSHFKSVCAACGNVADTVEGIVIRNI